MSWRRLWFRRALRRWRIVSGYVVAFATAVLLFYFFETVGRSFQQDISGYFGGFLVGVLRVFQGIVLLSACWMVVFFHQLVLERERPVLGLLWTLGLSPKGRLFLVLSESLFLGIWGLVIGLAAGVILEPAFLLAMTVALDLPTRLPYRPNTNAILLTVGIFLALALLEGLVNGIRLMRRWPRLLFVRREPRHPGRPSLVASVAGVALMAAAYLLAVTVHPWAFEQQARAFAEGRSPLPSQLVWLVLVPVLLLLTLVGSWLILRESFRGAVAVARRTPVVSARLLVSGSEIAWRVREHALGTAVLAGLLAFAALGGTALATAQLQFLRSAIEDQPSIIEIRATDPSSTATARETARQLAAFLEREGFGPVEAYEFEVVPGFVRPVAGTEPVLERPPIAWLPPGAVPALIVERDAYEELRRTIVRFHPELDALLPSVPPLAPDQAFLVLQGTNRWDPSGLLDAPWLVAGDRVELVALPMRQLLTGEAVSELAQEIDRAPQQQALITGYDTYRGRIVSRGFGIVPSSLVIVVDSETFAALQRPRDGMLDPGAGSLLVTSLFYDDWQASASKLEDWVHTPGNVEGDVTVSPLPTIYRQERQNTAALLFLLGAVAALFLVAYGATMGFRILEASWDDVRRARLLLRLGAAPALVRSLFRWEIVFLFLAPLGLAALHSLVAVVDWGRTMAVGTVLRFHPLWTPLIVWTSILALSLVVVGCWIAALGQSTVREVMRRAASEREPE